MWVRAPGRANLMGGHVDYSHGLVFPVAIERAVDLLAAPVEDDLVTLMAPDQAECVTWHLNDLSGGCDRDGHPLPAWARYPAGVALALSAAGFAVRGMQALYAADIPVGAGLSSSAAVTVAFALAWSALGSWQVDKLRLAQICQQAENAYVGVACGLMDPFASLFGREGHVLCFDPRTLAWEALPLPAGTTVVIADSGVRRSLVDSGFNERRASCERAVALLAQHVPGMRTLRDISPREFERLGRHLPPLIRRRARYVVQEIARGFAAREALRRGAVAAFGALMFTAHEEAARLYETSTPELDTLVDLARHSQACLGARISGGGFGGCTVNLVLDDQADALAMALRQGFQGAFGRAPSVFASRPAGGAVVQRLQ